VRACDVTPPRGPEERGAFFVAVERPEAVQTSSAFFARGSNDDDDASPFRWMNCLSINVVVRSKFR